MRQTRHGRESAGVGSSRVAVRASGRALRVAALAALLAGVAAEVQGVTSPAYRGLVYPERPVATLPLLGGVAANTLTGNLVVVRRLLTVPSRGVPLEAFLTYNSDRRKVSSPCGKGWTFSYHMRYVADGAGNVSIVWGDGRVDRFVAAGGGAFTSPPGVFATLSAPAAGQLALRTKRGLEYRFFEPTHRRLTAIVDLNGNALTLAYDAAGHLEQLADGAGRQWQLAYDSRGRLVSLTDPNLPRVFAFAYDAQDRLLSITDPLGESESYGYGEDGLLVAVTDRRGSQGAIAFTAPQGPAGSRLVQGVSKGGSTVTLAYDTADRTTTVTDPNGGHWKYAYSGSDLLTAVTDPLGFAETIVWGTDKTLLEHTDRRGAAATYEYDANGNRTRSTVPLAAGSSAVTTVTWNATCNRPATVTDPRGNTWTFAYDGRCNLVTATDPAALGTGAGYLYDQLGQRTQVTDRSGRVTSFTYDPAGNLATRTDALGHAWEYQYDDGGRLVGITDPLDHHRAFTYDALGRLIVATDALGSDATFEYDEAGNLVRATDREGGQTQASYDALHRLAGTTNALGDSDAYAYDAAGNLTTYTDRRGNAWLRAVDARHRTTSRSNPLGRTWSYTYDANGNLASRTDAKGQVTTFAYDAADRLIQRTFANGSRSLYTWDANGNLATAIDRVSAAGAITSSLAFLYDAANRTTRSTETLLNRFVGKSWDGEGRQLSEVDGAGKTTTYQYDGAGRLFRITSSVGTATFTLDADGRRTSDQRNNGVVSSYTYDANHRVATHSISGPGSPPPAVQAAASVYASFAFTRDANGDIVSALRQNGENVAFTRDGLRRILTEQGTLGGAYTQSFAYDANGNRLTSTLAKPGSTRVITIAFDAANRAVTQSNLTNGSGATATFTLDLNGSRTLATFSSGSPVSYTYNVRDQLIGSNAGGSAAAFAYDALDRFQSRTVSGSGTQFLYDWVPVTVVQGGAVLSSTAYEPSTSGCTSCGGGGTRVPVTVDALLGKYHLVLSGNGAAYVSLVTGAGGSTEAKRDFVSDDWTKRLESGFLFTTDYTPNLVDPALGTVAFPNDMITFRGDSAFGSMTRVPLNSGAGRCVDAWPGDAAALAPSEVDGCCGSDRDPRDSWGGCSSVVDPLPVAELSLEGLDADFPADTSAGDPWGVLDAPCDDCESDLCEGSDHGDYDETSLEDSGFDTGGTARSTYDLWLEGFSRLRCPACEDLLGEACGQIYEAQNLTHLLECPANPDRPDRKYEGRGYWGLYDAFYDMMMERYR